MPSTPTRKPRNSQPQAGTAYHSFGMLMQGRNYAGGAGYRWGFGSQSKLFEIGEQYDYLFRTLNGKICRFISVDPLTAAYPSNTPFAFAENRSINSIDLEGKEVRRNIDYNVITNEFKVEIVLICYLDVEDINMSFLEQQHLRTLLVSRFSYAFDGVRDSRRQITYSGQLQYDENAKYGIQYYNSTRDAFHPGPKVQGCQGEVNTYDNVIPIPTSWFYRDLSELRKKSISSVVRTTIHEWGHASGLNHPFENHTGVSPGDVQLRKEGSNFMFSIPKDNFKYIENNAMMYFNHRVLINGINLVDKIGEINKDKMVKFSPDQIKLIMDNINNDPIKQDE